MWNSISGNLSEKGSDFVCLEEGGVEWQLYTSTASINSLPGVGKRIKMYTFLHHRDDQMKLYGFSSRQERGLFLELLRVDGVGPRLVIRILSGISAKELYEALSTGNVKRLVQIPGLGTKTAQKMNLALEGKLVMESDSDNVAVAETELVEGVMNLGFGQRESREAIQTAIEGTQDIQDVKVREQEILSRALVWLGSLSSGKSSKNNE